MGRRTRTGRVALAAALAAVGAPGCGLGPGPGAGEVSVTVTQAFGARTVGTVTRSRVPGSETVMRLLERSFRVETRYGGGYVQAIDGQAGGAPRRDWFYYVNGVQAPVGAASTAVNRGDRIWWDLHDWRATNSIPAVVGSFPEPFVHGVGGKRLPTTLECAVDEAAACNTVATALTSAGVPVARQAIGTGSGTHSLGIVVGTWRQVQPQVGASLIAHGPGASGVYARFRGSGGSSLDLLDPRGQVARTLAAGTGLIAATHDTLTAPIWFVTGTDRAGVLAAAEAITPSRLHNRFALAVRAGQDLPVPLGRGTP